MEGIDAADRLPHAEAGRLVRQALAFGPDAAGLPAPEIALRKWTLPWRPIEIAWRVALQLPDELDAPAELGSRTSCSRITRCARGSSTSTPSTTRSTSCPTSTRAGRRSRPTRAPALEVLLEGRVDEALLQRLRDRPLIAQALGGFTPALTMLDQNLQLPVADPDGSPLDAEFVARVAAGVGDQARFAPVPDNPFAPMRGGRFRITALRLVDEFGRWRDVDTSAIVVSETIPRRRGRNAASAAPDPACPARLPLADRGPHRDRGIARAGRAARSAAGWCPTASTTGSCSTTATGPRSAASPPAPATDAAAMVRRARHDDATGTVEDALVGRNDVIAGFARSLAERGAGYLQRVLPRRGRDARARSPPAFAAADQALAVLVGEPLVLVQAELDLSLLGLPSIDMSLRALRATSATGDPLQRTDEGITQVRFPRPARQPARGRRRAHRLLPAARRRNGAGLRPFYADRRGDHDAIHGRPRTRITSSRIPTPRRSR